MAAQLIDKAILDDSEYLKALKRIDSNIAKMTNTAEKSFGNVAKSAKTSGLQIGAIAGVTTALVSEFINLGKRAVDALAEIGERSIQTAIEIDTLKARLTGIFDGSQEAADQAFTFIQQKSRELGIDLGELAGAFLPKTESLAQFERVAKIATALARSDPEQGAIGARIAIIEALSGTFTSLQRRFEIPKEDINKIKDAFDKEGIEGFITALEDVLAASGKSFEDLADTAQTAFSRVGIASQQILGRVGTPIVESLEEAANKILEFVDANEDDLIVFADTIGRAIADVIDLIGGLDFSQFDTQTLIDAADFIFRIIEGIKLVVAQLTLFSNSLGLTSDTLDIFVGFITGIDDALVTAAQVLALARAGYEGLGAAVASIIPVFEALFEAAIKAATFDYVGAAQALGEATQAAANAQFDLQAGQDAARASFEESLKSFGDYQSAVEDNATAQDELRQTLEEQAGAGTAAADAIQAKAAADRQAAEDAEKLEAAQAKVNEAFAKAEKDFQRKLEDVNIAFERKQLDIQIEFAQKREDAARNNLEKLADIRRKHGQDIADAATDLERKEEAIARKFADERIDLERDQRRKRVDVETSFREKLQDIQKDDAFDLEEAERKRDAVAFLRILRQQQKKVSDAQTDRQRELDELKITGERRKEELAVQQQRELREAQIANEQKLEDLRLNLERQIEAQNIAYAQQLDDIAINEQRKNEELARSRERDIEDANRAYERKLADLRAALEAELKLIEEFAARKAELEAQIAATEQPGRSNRASSPRSSTGALPAPRSSLPPAGTSRQGQVNQARQRAGRNMGGRRQFGGLVNAGGSYPVGENGPELFTPSANGRILPNSALVMPTMQPRAAINNISNVRQGAQISVPDAAGLLNNPIAIRQITNIVYRIMGETG